jgi:hypothetical protein
MLSTTLSHYFKEDEWNKNLTKNFDLGPLSLDRHNADVVSTVLTEPCEMINLDLSVTLLRINFLERRKKISTFQKDFSGSCRIELVFIWKLQTARN